MSASMTSSYLNRSTPGVYINEIPAFGNSIVGVATAVPVFIGYTQFAADPVTGAPLYNTPVPITSMTEFSQYFGGAAPVNYTITAIAPPSPPPYSSTSGETSASSSGGGTATTAVPAFSAYYTVNGSPVLTGFALAPDASSSQFNLYWAMQLFFANGGNQCFVVSVGSYWANEYPTSAVDTSDFIPNSIETGDPTVTPPENGLLVGLQAAGYAIGPTMIVIPEACQLGSSDYEAVVDAMIAQAASLQDRVAILDLPNAMTSSTLDLLQQGQSGLATAISSQAANLSYAVAYAPALNASVVSVSNVYFTNLLSDDNTVINNILTTQATQMYSGGQAAAVQGAVAAAFPVSTSGTGLSTSGSYGTMPSDPTDAEVWVRTLDNYLMNALPIFKQIETLIASGMNVMPASGVLAGIWSKSDSQSGVWNAPANIALASVTSPLYNMSDAEQGTFNVPLSGQAIDVIRAQPGRGTVVWGARTLDGNSQDYRYVQVRRTLIYLEQSIKTALRQYVFAPNTATTWSTVTSSIASFLTGLWQQGGLMGAKPSDAFTVSCGLGVTMTAQDVLNGYMIVSVALQMVHPAEFIELTFTQMMGS